MFIFKALNALTCPYIFFITPLSFGFDLSTAAIYKDELRKYEFAYIRFSRGDIEYYKLIKFLSKNNVKVIVEIPTYPYAQQFSYFNIKHLVYGILDILIWKSIRKYIYRISTTNSLHEIQKIKCICINNGIDLEELPMPNNKYKKSLNLVGIANISKWHGYDRVIKGLHKYYSDKNNCYEVRFHIIGEGDEKLNLIKLVDKFNLNSVVKFEGVKIGSELNNIMNDMDIGISSLALFRAGSGHDPIKTKEFLGRGIPVILGYDDKLVDMNLPYVIKVKEDESDLDIEGIVNKYLQRQWTNEDIKSYARKNLSWETQIKKIVEAVEIK